MYYIQVDDEIVLADEDKKRLKDTLLFMPQYKNYEIIETQREIIELDGKYHFKDKIQDDLDKKERERLDNLSLTAADVERAIYKAKGIDFEDILELVKDNPNIDIKALKIELKANNFYRGNPWINEIGRLLGYSECELDYLFEEGNFPKIGDYK